MSTHRPCPHQAGHWYHYSTGACSCGSAHAAGNQDEIKAALAEQEEHIRRSTSCRGAVGAPHDWTRRTVGGADYTACGQCGVTRTHADYRILRGDGRA